MRKFLVLNGPNLNLVGFREPEYYGAMTLDEIEDILQKEAETWKISLECKQTNSEGELVEWVHQAEEEEVEFIVINPGAYTHTSIALRDAFLATDIPFLEVHMSNIYSREKFRHKSYLSDIAVGTITGLGFAGYVFALQFAITGTSDFDDFEGVLPEQ